MSTPTRVMHLLWTFDVGGAEKFAASFLRNVDRKRWECALFNFSPDGVLLPEFESLGIPLYLLKHGSRIRYLTGLRKAVKDFRPDILHPHNTAPTLYASLVGTLTGIPVLSTRHGVPLENPQGTVNRWISRRLTQRFIAVSDEVRTVMIRSQGHRPDKVFTIINGIDTVRFASAPANEYRRQLKVPDDAFLFVTVGRLHPQKAHHAMVRAMDLIRKRGREPYLVIAGTGSLEAPLRQQIQNLALNDRIKLPGNWTDVPGLLACADAFVLSSVTEGVPLALLEAQAAGLPSLSTAVGGVPQVVEHEVSGLLTPVGSVEALAEGMQRLMDDVALRERLGRNGQQSVRERFSIQRMLNEYFRHYSELLQMRGTQPQEHKT